jgi:hypothetical protein
VHVVCIVDPINSYAAVYTNGILETTRTGSWPTLNSVSTAWSFLGRSLFSSDPYLNATIDELRIYDGRLTPPEIATDYQFGPAALALPASLAQSKNGTSVTLSWPAWASGFSVESTTNLSGGNWLSYPSPPALAADSWRLSIPQTNTARFFRLQR